MSVHNLVIFSSTFVCERVQKKRKHFGIKIKGAEHKKRTHPKTVAGHLYLVSKSASAEMITAP